MGSKMSRDQAVEYAKAELGLLKDAWWSHSAKDSAESPCIFDQMTPGQLESAKVMWGNNTGERSAYKPSIYTWMAHGLAGWSGYKPIEGASPYTLERLDQLLEQSLTDSVAFDAVKLIAADFECRRQAMPEPLSGWALAVQQEQLRRPKMKRGKIRERYFFRDVAIHQLLQEIVQFGFTATRSDEIDHRNSACDIVAEAMTDVGDSSMKAISHDSIKDIWERLNKGGRG